MCNARFAHCASCCSLRSLHCVLLDSSWNHLEQPQASGTRVALMELRAAPYPYSKMCELCELCELLERKIPPLCDGIYLFSTQQNLFVIFGDPKELCSNGERKNDGALISIHRNPLAKSLLTRGILERPKGNWNGLRPWNAAGFLPAPWRHY